MLFPGFERKQTRGRLPDESHSVTKAMAMKTVKSTIAPFPELI
jgi:hypothetical protein